MLSAIACLGFVCLGPTIFGQVPQGETSNVRPQTKVVEARAAFDVATIKPANGGPKDLLGFRTLPGGRVQIGNATVRMLLHYALDVEDFQIAGGPEWASRDRYDIEALSADPRSAAATLTSATPTDLQRKMILTLLEDRFGLKIRHASKTGNVLFLVRVNKSPVLVESKHPTADPRGGIGITQQGVPNGDAYALNLSMPAFAQAISRELEIPVVDHTHLSGGYDFIVRANPPNDGDAVSGVLLALKPLGLKVEPGKGLIDTVVIESVSRPTPN